MKEFFDWVGFFLRIVGALMVSSTYVGLAMNWWSSTAVALVFCYSGVGLAVAGFVIGKIVSLDTRD
jgi:hypothetical protein